MKCPQREDYLTLLSVTIRSRSPINPIHPIRGREVLSVLSQEPTTGIRMRQALPQGCFAQTSQLNLSKSHLKAWERQEF